MKNPKFLEANMTSFDVHQNGQLALSWSVLNKNGNRNSWDFMWPFLPLQVLLSILLLN